MTAIGLDFLLKSMELNKELLQGTVIALKANYIIVEIKYNKSLLSINNTKNPSNFIQLICTKRNRLAYKGYSISVGDIVSVEEIDWVNCRGVINRVEPRLSLLNRPCIANFTDLFIVISLHEPLVEINQLSRFLIKAEEVSTHVYIILTKIDLVPKSITDDYTFRLKKWGYKTFPISIKIGDGIDQLLDKLRLVKLSVLCGPSGVGKSSLINYLIPGKSIPVGDLSKKLKRGKHTTRHVELFSLGQESFIADTPGFNKPDFDINPHSLGRLFPEIRSQLKNKKCKFRDCLHLGEPGCIISRNWERYDTYQNFVKEMINLHH